MRRSLMPLACALMLALTAAVASAQSRVYSSSNAEYELELPSAMWRVLTEPNAAHQHAEFIYGDRSDGYLRVRREVVDAGVTPAQLAQQEQELRLRFLPGFAQGKQERFEGRLSGTLLSYEYTNGGKPMTGRIYYLQADNRTIYSLRFTGLRDRLARIRNQTDAIARSFRVK